MESITQRQNNIIELKFTAPPQCEILDQINRKSVFALTEFLFGLEEKVPQLQYKQGKTQTPKLRLIKQPTPSQPVQKQPEETTSIKTVKKIIAQPIFISPRSSRKKVQSEYGDDFDKPQSVLKPLSEIKLPPYAQFESQPAQTKYGQERTAYQPLRLSKTALKPDNPTGPSYQGALSQTQQRPRFMSSN